MGWLNTGANKCLLFNKQKTTATSNKNLIPLFYKSIEIIHQTTVISAIKI